MLFDGDSALTHLPQSMPVAEVMQLDAMRYAAEMVELSFTRLCEGLTAIVGENDEQKHRQLSVQVLTDAWAVIDSADRLRSLVRTSKLFDEDDKASFDTSMKPIRDLRNTVQHLDGKIASLAARKWPVWGSLRWFEWIEPPHVGRVCVMVPGSRVTGRPEMAQAPRTTDTAPGVSEVVLLSDGVEVSLRAIREYVVHFAHELEQGVRDEHSQGDGSPQLVTDLFLSADVDFRRG